MSNKCNTVRDMRPASIDFFFFSHPFQSLQGWATLLAWESLFSCCFHWHECRNHHLLTIKKKKKMQRLSQEELFGSQAETFGVKVKPKHRKEDQKHLLSPPLSRKHKAMENFALITSFFSVIFFFFISLWNLE